MEYQRSLSEEQGCWPEQRGEAVSQRGAARAMGNQEQLQRGDPRGKASQARAGARVAME